MLVNEMEPGQVITFYSYKGGVGRSMALANVACLISEIEVLASRRLLVIDWDLEAPGLHRFFPGVCDRPENIARPGVLEYFCKLFDLLEKDPSFYKEIVQEDGWKLLSQIHPIEEYLIRDVHPGIDLIKAGMLDSRYAERVAGFSWVSFFERFGGTLKAFRELVSNDYFYCFIDSRTGFTDTSGVCTMLLPEKLVIVFTPNKQSSLGAVDLAERAIKYRRSAQDLRPLTIFPLPSRIDDAEEELRKHWRGEYQGAFEQVFQIGYDLERCDLTSYFDEAKLPYKSFYAYGENLAVLRERNEALTLHRAYKSFAKLLTTLENPWQRFDSAQLNRIDVEPLRLAERRVFISSALRDLPEHRDNVMQACMRLGMFRSTMVEHFTASDSSALEVSLKTLDAADLYIGVVGFRYGFVPYGSNISVTETEYNRALERGIPRLIFLMGDDHPVKATDVETGKGAGQLQKFRERLKREQVVAVFNSPDELKAQVIQALVPYREPEGTLHYASEIPSSPEIYIAHPYTLLQTHTLIGRKTELRILSDWIAGRDLQAEDQKAPGNSVRIMNIVAIGGMGKSALAWKWFNDISSEETKNLAGRMWWSFYESDATFENFVTRALAYVTSRPLDELQHIPAPDREVKLLAALDHNPFLLVLDGLERILIAYAGIDASRLDDGEVGQEKALRKTADPRAGTFLKKLAQVRRSRILVSSRLYPAELETTGGDPIPGTFKLRVGELTDEDSVELWRAFGVDGSREELTPIFNTFAKHPLLIQALAGEVKRFRKAPGNFKEWRKANPQFDPTKFSELTQTMSFVLENALRGLGETQREVLQTIVAFRKTVSYNTLAALLVGDDRACATEFELDGVLGELEDRGLLGWDKRANRYNVHPIVRGVVWGGLSVKTRHDVYTTLHTYFEASPTVDSSLSASSLEDLMPAIELFNTLIGLERYDDAAAIFLRRLNYALWVMSANSERIDLLEMLFPDGLDRMPRLNQPATQAVIINALALSYRASGQPARSVSLIQEYVEISGRFLDSLNSSIALGNLSDVFRVMGALRKSETAAVDALSFSRQSPLPAEGSVLNSLALVLAIRGVSSQSEIVLERSIRVIALTHDEKLLGDVNFYRAQRALFFGEFSDAAQFGIGAWNMAHVLEVQKDFIRAARVQGEAALGLNDLTTADERLHHALTRARNVNLIEEELPALVALAELRRRQGDAKAARELLEDVWELAERGPYPLFHADAFNVLAQIERDEENTTATIEAATTAYRLAWCDGPPFAYHWGLEKAKKHLKELGAPEPEMPPFDESKFEPMPEVEINPKDEFYVDEESVN